jgi:hypothetical protein
MEVIESIKTRISQFFFETNKRVKASSKQREINQVQRQIQQHKFQLGSKYYEIEKGGESDPTTLGALVEKIDGLMEDIKQKEQEKAEIGSAEYFSGESTGVPAPSINMPAVERGSIGKFLGSILSSGSGLALLLFFFLPWILVSCSGQVMGKFSGWEMATGTEINTGLGYEQVDPQPMIFLVLISALVILWTGYRVWRLKGSKILHNLVFIGAGGLALAVLMMFKAGITEGMQENYFIEVIYLNGFKVSQTVSILAIIGGVLNFFIPQTKTVEGFTEP